MDDLSPQNREREGISLRQDFEVVGTATEARPPQRPRTVGPLGWLLVTAASPLLLLASWNLYPDGPGGMKAGFRDLGIALVVFFASCFLRCGVRRGPWLLTTGVAGAALVLEGTFLRAASAVTTCEVLAGIVILIGTALQLSQDEDG